MKGKLFYAPFSQPPATVLDLGAGSGIVLARLYHLTSSCVLTGAVGDRLRYRVFPSIASIMGLMLTTRSRPVPILRSTLPSVTGEATGEINDLPGARHRSRSITADQVRLLLLTRLLVPDCKADWFVSVPPNCKFEIDDYEEDWTFGKFDFIHGRVLTGSLRDWPRFFQQAYECVLSPSP